MKILWKRKMGAVINRTWGFSCLWLFFPSFPHNERKEKIIFRSALYVPFISIIPFDYHNNFSSSFFFFCTDEIKVTEAWRCQITCPRPHRQSVAKSAFQLKSVQLQHTMLFPLSSWSLSFSPQPSIPNCFSVEATDWPSPLTPARLRSLPIL